MEWGKNMQATTWRKVWNWHLWLGVVVLMPLVFWLATALVFALWPIESIRGKDLSTGQHLTPVPLQGWMVPPREALEGATTVTLRSIANHPLALVHRGDETEVWDLTAQNRLGAVLPLTWAREAARVDFRGTYEEEAIYLFLRSNQGQRVAGDGPIAMNLPSEYAGPLPAYGFRLRGGMHLYVDAISGEVRARRRSIWRIYDFAFRLHSLEFLPDGAKRFLMMTSVGLSLVLSITGLAMAVKRLRRAT